MPFGARRYPPRQLIENRPAPPVIRPRTLLQQMHEQQFPKPGGVFLIPRDLGRAMAEQYGSSAPPRDRRVECCRHGLPLHFPAYHCALCKADGLCDAAA